MPEMNASILKGRNMKTHSIYLKLLSVVLVLGLGSGLCAAAEPPVRVTVLTYNIYHGEDANGVWQLKVVDNTIDAGANIVSFNLDAFRSFDKKQGLNAPVGQTVTFAYTTALNTLLSKSSRQRIQVGDASTVFWSLNTGEAA